MVREKNTEERKRPCQLVATETPPPSPKEIAELLAFPPTSASPHSVKMKLPQLRQLRQHAHPRAARTSHRWIYSPATRTFAAFNGPEGVVAAEGCPDQTPPRHLHERQLNEVMVDFWLNHFNVYMRKSQQAPYYIAAYERTRSVLMLSVISKTFSWPLRPAPRCSTIWITPPA